jgi:hypothetical protein
MAANEILEQAAKLYTVSDSLAALAQHEAPLSEPLSLLAKSVRHSAALLEVMVAVKFGPERDVENRSN